MLEARNNNNKKKYKKRKIQEERFAWRSDDVLRLTKSQENIKFVSQLNRDEPLRQKSDCRARVDQHWAKSSLDSTVND